jgi:LuxR family maltose regulon positive regulatory protein
MKGVGVVAIAENAREAIELAVQYRPDVVIMDILMPDLNSLVICRKLPRTQITALSMHSRKKHIEKMLSSGASGYIFKESAIKELNEAMQEVNNGITWNILKLKMKRLTQ